MISRAETTERVPVAKEDEQATQYRRMPASTPPLSGQP